MSRIRSARAALVPDLAPAPGRHRRTRGQSLVELALILPILLLLVAATVDLGRVFYSQITITNAAREGAYEAAYQPTSFIPNGDCSKTSNRIMCRVLSEAKGSFVQIAKADVAVACAPACTATIGNTVTVTVRSNFSLITPILAPFMGGSGVVLTSSASAQIITDPPIVAALPTPTPTPTPTPSPTPTPTPTAGPTATPTPAPTAAPTPTPTPLPCFAPTAAFTVSPTGGFKDGTVFTFTDTSLNMPVGRCSTVWSWNFGDGNGNSGSDGTSMVQNPSYTFQKSNTNPGFTVTLAVSNWVNGSPQSSTTTKVIRVDP